MFLAVISGATLLILPWRKLTTGDVTLDTVTILHCTPSLLVRLASCSSSGSWLWEERGAVLRPGGG